MNGVQEMQSLREGGFNEDEVGVWAQQKTQELTDAGFNDGEIGTYFGKPPFDPAPIEKHVNDTITQATAPKTEGGAPTQVDNPLDAFVAGLQSSSAGLFARGKAPSMEVPQEASMMTRIAQNVGSLAGDIPAMVAGFVIGGGPLSPVTATAGAFALPAGLRKILMDKYENGEVDDFAEFWARLSGTAIDTSKAWVTGAATGAVGKAIKLAPAMMSHTARSSATMTGEIATMVTVGSALEGKVPEPEDFIETALALGIVKGTHKAATKLRGVYAKTGITPAEAAQDATRDVTIAQDLASENIDVPRSYDTPVSVSDIHAKAEQMGVQWDENPAFMAFTERITGKDKLDDLSPRDRQDVQAVLEDLDRQMKEGQQEIPVPPPTVGERPIVGREVSPEDDAPLFNKSQRTPDAEQGDIFNTRAPLPAHEASQVPRHELPPEQNAEILARAEKGQADVETSTAGPSIIEFLRSKGGVRDDGGELKGRDVDIGRFGKNALIRKGGMSLDDAAELVADTFPETFPARDINALLSAIDKEISGKGGDPDWLNGLMTGKGKLTRERVGEALEKIFADKGRDKGADVEKVKAALFSDKEFAESSFAPKTQEDWDRLSKQAVQEWEPDIAMGGGAPPKPPKGKLYDDQLAKPKDEPGEYVPPKGNGLYNQSAAATGGPTLPPVPTNLPVSDAAKTILKHITQAEDAKPSLTLSDIRTSAIDNLNPIKRKLLDAGLMSRDNAKSKLPTAQNPYFLERLTRGVMGKFTFFMKRGSFDFDSYENVTKGYEQILDPVKNDLDGFRAYIASKRAIAMHKEGKATVFPLPEAQVVVREGAAKYEKVAQERIEFKHAALDYLKKSGILSDKDVKAMKDAVKDHIPMYRFFEEDSQGRPVVGNSVRNPLRRQKGSDDYLVKDPIVSDIKDTALFIALAEKNAARLAYVALGKGFVEKKPDVFSVTKLTKPEIVKMFNEFMTIRTVKDKSATTTETTKTETKRTGGDGEVKPEPSKQAKMVEARIRDALKERGYHEGEADQMMRRLVEMKESGKGTVTETKESVERLVKEIETTIYVPELDIRVPSEVATIFRKMQEPLKDNEIAAYKDGKREVYTVDPGVAEAFEDMDRISANKVVGAMFHVPAGLLRAGVILTPDYITRNILRDAISAMIYSGAHPIKTVLGGVELIRKGEAWEKWMKGGGANATMVALDRNFISKELVDLHLKTGFLTRSWNVAKTPLDVLRAASEFAENATRLGAVRSDLLKAKDKATIQALALISREATVDFSVHGRDTQEYGKATAFLNPTIQGIDRFAREMRAKPVATTAKALAYVTLPSILLWWAGSDDEEIRNLPNWQKYLFNIARIPLPGTDDEGKQNSFLLRIPRTQEFGILFGAIPERLLEQFVKDNPDALDGIGEALMQAFTPSLIPTALAPILDQSANRSSFTHQPIVPSHLEGLLPEYQYTDYTTEAAKAIGGILGAFPGMHDAAIGNKQPYIGGVARALTTPIMLEMYVRDWTGGTGAYLLQLADAALRKTGVLPDPVSPAWKLSDVPFVKAFVIKYPTASAQPVQDFFENHDVAMRYQKTADYLMKSGDSKAEAFIEENQQNMLHLSSVRETLAGQSRMIRLINKNPAFSSSEQAQMIDTLYRAMIDIAKGGNDAMKEFMLDAKDLRSQQQTEELVAP